MMYYSVSKIMFCCFVFAEELASFWNAFENRISLDRHLTNSLDFMHAKGLLTEDQYLHIMKLEQNIPFKYKLISESVRDNINGRTQTTFENLMNFLRRYPHYDIMYKQGSELSKSMFKCNNTFDDNINTCSILNLCV